MLKLLKILNTLLKGVTKTTKNETKEQKGGVLGMLLGTLGASLLGNMLAGKGIVRAAYENEIDFCRLILWKALKYWSIITMTLDLMDFFQKIICLNKKGCNVSNKPWQICRCWYPLDCFILWKLWNCLFR